MEPSTPEEIQEFMRGRRSGKTIDSATKKAMQEMQIASYFSRLRSDSPRRWLKRIMKPRELRYQSLLRAAMKKKPMICCNYFPGCNGHSVNKARNERRRKRQGRIAIDTVRGAAVVRK